MTVAAPPLVSVLTPVLNGAEWLEACIESVRAQTHGRLEHVILDNASTDATSAVAERWAAADARIRVHRNRTTLPLTQNWNRAVELMSPEARYCWLLPADDLMYPQAVERMVAVALRHPEVGIVGALRQRGDEVQCGGLPHDQEVFPGRLIGRLFLEQRVFAIAPTTNLVRADLMRARQPFFPPQFFHSDIGAFLDILRESAFGFVHEVLAFSRTHSSSVTERVAEPQQTLLRDTLLMLVEYGADYFEPAELRAVEAHHLRRYYRRLLRSYLTRGGAEFRRNHLPVLRRLGRAPGAGALLRALADEIAATVARPGKALRHLRTAAGLR